MLIQLLETVGSYLDGHASLRDLEAWLVSNLQAILDSGDERAIQVVNEIDEDLIEHSTGLLDENSLREHLTDHLLRVGTIPFDFPFEPPSRHSFTTCSSETSRVAVRADEIDTVVNYSFSLELV
jgi:hypothetical protein